jgi:hypothetical protein
MYIISHWSSTINLEAASVCVNKAFTIDVRCISSADNFQILGVVCSCTISFSNHNYIVVVEYSLHYLI